MARKTKKALTMQFLDAATMSLKTVHLFDVSFAMKDGTSHVVQVYAPSASEVMDAATRLYANKGAFGPAVSFLQSEAA